MADLVKGEWGSLTIELPDFLDEVREDVNTIAELLVAYLDIAITALNLIKSFAFAFLDPLSALIKAIFDIIKQILADFRQAGIYITGDYGLLDYPYTDLKGGFQEYERRMVARLSDKADPTRPDVSALTDVYAVFTYVSTDISNIQKLIENLEQLMDFFNIKEDAKGSLPVPQVTKVTYGSDDDFRGLGDLAFWGDTPPNKVRLTWKVSTGTADPLSAFAGPGGFLITVSTLPDGIPLMYDRPLADAGQVEGKSGELQQPRDYGPVRDIKGRPIILYGGLDNLELNSELAWNRNVDTSGKVKDGVARVYGVQSPAKNDVIPLELLTDGTYTYFQNTFYVPLSTAALNWASSENTFVLNFDDMPHHAEINASSDGKMELKDLGIPSTLFIRIASCTSEIATEAVPYKYDLTTGTISAATPSLPFKVGMAKGTGLASVSNFSTTKKISFPQANTKAFLEALQTALVVLALSRPDLQMVDELEDIKGTAIVEKAKANKVLLKDVTLKRTGLEEFKLLLESVYPDYIEIMGAKGASPLEFRSDLLNRVEYAAQELRDRIGPNPEFEELIVNQTQNLRTVTWGDILAAAGDPAEEGLLSEGFERETILSSISKTSNASLSTDLIEIAELEREQLQLQNELGVNTDLSQQQSALKTQIELLKEEAPAGLGKSITSGIVQNPWCSALPTKDLDSFVQTPGVIRLPSSLMTEAKHLRTQRSLILLKSKERLTIILRLSQRMRYKNFLLQQVSLISMRILN